MKPIVILYSCDRGADVLYALALGEQGYKVVHCPDIAALRLEVSLAAKIAPQGNEPVVAVLAADMPQNRVGAGILAAMPQFGVVIMLESSDDASLMSALQLGVDACCQRGAVPQVLALTVQSVMRRLEQNHAGTVVARNALQAFQGAVSLPEPGGQWQLHDRAWLLQTPAGKRVRLTSAERSFILELIQRPGQTATHADLWTACGNPIANADVVKSRVGVVVSRLRSKVAQQGVELPLKSLYGRGYMFTGAIAATDITAGDARLPQDSIQEDRFKKTMLSR